MLYNGREEIEDRFELKLSDLYNPKMDNPELELRVTVLNINLGHNSELMDKCDTLNEYAIYVDKVRRYQKLMSNDEAVRKAVDECIEENILKDFFTKQKEEVIAMSIFEYDEEAVLDYIGQKQWEDGRAAGRDEGLLLEQISAIRRNILKGRSADSIAEFMAVDIGFVRRFAEYIAKNVNITDDELLKWYSEHK